jgi:hypothetical protein
VRRHQRDDSTGSVRPNAIQVRGRVGRFDDGVSTGTAESRGRVGGFDDGMSTCTAESRGRVGRFDDELVEDSLAA